MRRNYNGLPVQAKVLEYPNYDEVLSAELNGSMISPLIGFCHSGVELVTRLEITRIRRAMRVGHSAFRFMGDYANFSLSSSADRPALEITRGVCLVKVDEEEQFADIGFHLTHHTEPL